MIFKSGTGEEISLTLNDVAHVPTFERHLFSLIKAAQRGYKSHMDENAIYLLDDRLVFPSNGNVCTISAHRLDSNTATNATIAPSHTPGRSLDINLFHCSYGHLHEGLLHDTAKQLGVTLTGQLQPCSGCCMGKGL